MRGGLIGRIGCLLGVVALALGTFAGAAVAQSNPRALVYQLIDQLQTGQPRPVDLSPAVRKVIADQTGDSGISPSLARLGVVTHVKIDTTTPMQRGTVYSVTATHDKGVSTWQVGIAADTRRIEYVEFKIARSTASPPVEAAKPTAKSLAPRADATPQPSYAPAAPAPVPRTASPAEISAACRKFPNLC